MKKKLGAFIGVAVVATAILVSPYVTNQTPAGLVSGSAYIVVGISYDLPAKSFALELAECKESDGTPITSTKLMNAIASSQASVTDTVKVIMDTFCTPKGEVLVTPEDAAHTGILTEYVAP